MIRTGRKLLGWPALLLILLTVNEAGYAGVFFAGQVNPAPPAGGGTVSGTMTIGNTSLGLMDINGGTPLTISNGAILGNQTGGIGLVTLDGFGSDLIISSSSGDMVVGASGTGSISVSNLARVAIGDDTLIGTSAGGRGEINISDLGTVWNTDNVNVGQSGQGTVNILNGGQMISGSSILGTASQGDGRVIIADAMSQWRINGGVTVGDIARGSLSIFDGGMLRTTTGSTLGSGANSVGNVEVNGAHAQWETVNGNMTIGSAGTGRLHVFNGGRVSIGGGASLASNTGSYGELWIDGLGSTMTVGGTLATGVGEANVTVSNGAVLSANIATFGAAGRVTLDGGRFEVATNNGTSNVGLIKGTGTIKTVNLFNATTGESRGRVLVGEGDALFITGGLNNSGLVDIDGGELEIGGNSTNSFDIDVRNGAVLRFGGSGFTNNNGGQLSITAGDVDIFGNVANNSGAQIVVGNGASAIFHDTITNNGNVTVFPGSTLLALEQLSFTGNSQLNFQLGTSNAVYDDFPIAVGGSVLANGDLAVTLASGYEPQEGDVFPLIYASGGINGTFDEQLPTLAGGLDWQATYTINTLLLTVVGSTISGDFDGDGDVDGRDFLLWQRNPAIGDLADWQENYGAGILTAKLTIPEPSTFVLLFLSMAAWARRR